MPSPSLRRFPAVFFCSVLLLMIGMIEAAAKHPHVVVILVDDMGYGDAGCYNPESRIPTPHIDRLAAEGMRFTDAHAAGPLCHPSRYGLLTGTFPFRTDVSVWPRHPVIRADELTIGKLLQSVGYRTAMVGKWHLGFEEKGYDQPLRGGPVDRGFDTFFGMRASTDIPPYFYITNDHAVLPPTNHIEANRSEEWSPIQGAFWRAGGTSPDMNLKDVLPRFTEEAVKVIAGHERDARPLMLYLAYPAPHTPWLPAEEFAGKSGAGVYGDFMMMVDAEIGRVLAELHDRDLLEDTLLIFASDNGPVWYEKDVRRFGHASVAGLRGLKGDAWEGGHRMPFLVRWPGRVEAGTVSDQTISFTDLLATLAEIADVELPENAGRDSFSILPVLEGRHPDDRPIRGPVVVQSARGLMSIQSNGWKYIDGRGSGGFSGPPPAPEPGDPEGQLYHLAVDRNETTNLYLERPDMVQELTSLLKSVRSRKGSRSP